MHFEPDFIQYLDFCSVSVVIQNNLLMYCDTN